MRILYTFKLSNGEIKTFTSKTKMINYIYDNYVGIFEYSKNIKFGYTLEVEGLPDYKRK